MPRLQTHEACETSHVMHRFNVALKIRKDFADSIVMTCFNVWSFCYMLLEVDKFVGHD